MPLGYVLRGFSAQVYAQTLLRAAPNLILVSGSALYEGDPIAIGIYRNMIKDTPVLTIPGAASPAGGSSLSRPEGVILTNGNATYCGGTPDYSNPTVPATSHLAGSLSQDLYTGGVIPGVRVRPRVPNPTDVSEVMATIPATAIQVFDACALGFSFIPDGNMVHLAMYFGSYEYPEFTDQFTDHTRVYLNGVNIALVPGTSTPIGVDTVRASSNPNYFLGPYDNAYTDLGDGHVVGFSGVGYNGLVCDKLGTDPAPIVPGFSPIFLSGSVTPGVINTLRFFICDILDGIRDSGLFIAANSIYSDGAIPTGTSGCVLNLAQDTPGGVGGCALALPTDTPSGVPGCALGWSPDS